MSEETNIVGKIFNGEVDLVQLTVRGRRPHGAPKTEPPPEYTFVVPRFNSLQELLKIVPEEQLLRVINEEIVKPVAQEATDESLGEDGKLNPVIYESKFIEGFSPAQTTNRKDLKLAIEGATRELCDLLVSTNIATMSPEERERVKYQALQLQLKIKQLQEKLTKKRTAKSKKVAVSA